MHGSPPLVWDEQLAFESYKYIRDWKCFAGHSPHVKQLGQGENIFTAGKSGSFFKFASPQASMEAWYDGEVTNCIGGPEGFTDGCRNSATYGTVTGHFTTLVWRSSTRMGCANNDFGHFSICRYANEFPYFTNKMPNWVPTVLQNVYPRSKSREECAIPPAPLPAPPLPPLPPPWPIPPPQPPAAPPLPPAPPAPPASPALELTAIRATMSSVYYMAWSWPTTKRMSDADRLKYLSEGGMYCIDGKLDPSAGYPYSCRSLTWVRDPWISLELPHEAAIDSVAVFNRAECCQEALGWGWPGGRGCYNGVCYSQTGPMFIPPDPAQPLGYEVWIGNAAGQKSGADGALYCDFRKPGVNWSWPLLEPVQWFAGPLCDGVLAW